MKIRSYLIIGILCIMICIAWTATAENVGSLRLSEEVPILLPSDIPNLTVFPQSIWTVEKLRNGVRVKNICVLWFFDPVQTFSANYPVENLEVGIICDSTKILTLAYEKLGEPNRYWIYIDGKPRECTEEEAMDFLKRADNSGEI